MDIDSFVDLHDPFADPQRWYEENYALVHDTLRRRGVPEAAIEDAIQVTFVTAYRRRTTYVGGSMAAWLYAIARRVASNTRRAEHRRGRKRQALTLVPPRAPVFADPETGVAVSAVRRFLATLRPIDREVFALSEIEGFTGPEVAEALGHNLATTYSRIRTLRTRFESFCADPTETLAARRRQRATPAHSSWFVLTTKLLPVGASKGALALSTAMSIGIASVTVLGVHGAARALEPEPPIESVVRSAVTVEPTRNETPTSREPPSPQVGPIAVTPAAATTAPPIRRVAVAKPRPSQPAPEPIAAPPVRLEDASVALREGRADDALAIVEQHARAHANGPLTDVRAALRIEALCGLGRVDAAHREIGNFERAHPDSPLLRRVRAACPDMETP